METATVELRPLTADEYAPGDDPAVILALNFACPHAYWRGYVTTLLLEDVGAQRVLAWKLTQMRRCFHWCAALDTLMDRYDLEREAV